jgi:hypothetical protein
MNYCSFFFFSNPKALEQQIKAKKALNLGINFPAKLGQHTCAFKYYVDISISKKSVGFY